jgi:hypothetical protein
MQLVGNEIEPRLLTAIRALSVEIAKLHSELSLGLPKYVPDSHLQPALVNDPSTTRIHIHCASQVLDAYDLGRGEGSPGPLKTFVCAFQITKNHCTRQSRKASTRNPQGQT